METSLIKFDAARRALAEAKSIDEVKDIRDKAEALRLYVKQQGESLEMQNDIAEIKLRAERRAGELLAEIERTTPQERGSLAHNPDRLEANRSYERQISDMSVSKYQAANWQRIASLPEETFEATIAEAKARSQELTSAGMLRKAKDLHKQTKRQEAIERGKAIEPSTLGVQLYHAEFQTIAIDSNSIDLILSDPPYPEDFLPLFDDLGYFANQWLKPGCLLAVMVGQSYLPEIIQALSQHLTYHWTIAYLTPGGQAVQLWQRKVNTFWKPVLIFSKGEYTGEWFGDVTKSDVNHNDKRFHEWGQSISGMVDLANRLCKPNYIVLDPFMGGGTTGLAVKTLGCHFIGIDCDEDNINIARSRLAQV